MTNDEQTAQGEPEEAQEAVEVEVEDETIAVYMLTDHQGTYKGVTRVFGEPADLLDMIDFEHNNGEYSAQVWEWEDGPLFSISIGRMKQTEYDALQADAL